MLRCSLACHLHRDSRTYGQQCYFQLRVCYQTREMRSSLDSTGFNSHPLLTKPAGIHSGKRQSLQPPWDGTTLDGTQGRALLRGVSASLEGTPPVPGLAVSGEASPECLPPVGKQTRHHVCAVQALLPNSNRTRVSVIPRRGYVILGNKMLLSGLPFIL